VYLADMGNYRIQVFTAGGKYLSMFGRHGQGRGELGRPVGVATDSSNMVYVSEWGNYRVSVFTSLGQFVMTFEGPGRFVRPCGLSCRYQWSSVCV
jgi:tripartite motif-containing protein 2/3/tripartite motif-containing protein 71